MFIMTRKTVYCGSKKLTEKQLKGTRYGTYDECRKKGQIRLWGVYEGEDVYGDEAKRLEGKKELEKERGLLVGKYNREQYRYERLLIAIERRNKAIDKYARGTKEQKARKGGIGVEKRDLREMVVRKRQLEKSLDGIKKKIAEVDEGLRE